MELSPNFTGTLRGFTNTFGNITGFVAPYFAGALTENNVSLKGLFNLQTIVEIHVMLEI